MTVPRVRVSEKYISCLETRQPARQSMGQCSEPETLPMSVTGREGFVKMGNV